MEEKKKEDISAAQESLEDRTHILAEKKSELDEIISETKQDEEKLRGEAKLLEEKSNRACLKRSSASGAMPATDWVSYVQRNACGVASIAFPRNAKWKSKCTKKSLSANIAGAF